MVGAAHGGHSFRPTDVLALRLAGDAKGWIQLCAGREKRVGGGEGSAPAGVLVWGVGECGECMWRVQMNRIAAAFGNSWLPYEKQVARWVSHR